MSAASAAIQELNRHYLRQHPDEVAEWLSELSLRRALEAVTKMPYALFLNVWAKLPPHVAHALYVQLPPPRAAQIQSRGDPTQAAQSLRGLDPDQREHYLQHIEPDLAQDFRRLLAYPPDSAGAIMDPVVAPFRTHHNARDVLKQLRRFRGIATRSVLVVAADGRLEGVE